MEPSPTAQLGTIPGSAGTAAEERRTGPVRPASAARSRRVLWAPREPAELGPDVAGDLPRYREWAQRRQAERLGSSKAGPVGPEIALLVVVDRPDPAPLQRCLEAIAAQTSSGWRLVLSVAGPLDPAAAAVLDLGRGPLCASRARVAVHHGEQAPDVARAAAMLSATTAPAFAVLGQHDVLAPDAVALLAAALADADLAYGDEDRLDREGLAYDPVLKPDWSPELCLSWPYTGRPAAMRREAVLAAGGIRPVDAGDWEHDLVLRLGEHSGRVAHVAEVLCHRPVGDVVQPASGGAVVAALARRGDEATVERGPLPGTWRVRRRRKHSPSVSAVVPFRDAPALLRACVDSVSSTTHGDDVELVLVDNGSEEPETLTLLERLEGRSGVTILRDPRPFNWAALNNAAVEGTQGEVLLFLNNDIEALRPGWLSAMVAQAVRPEIGAVGARLLYPGGRLQHAGVVLGLAGAAGHVLAGLAADRPGYLGMAVLARDCSAVTGACMATRRGVFEDLGGFDLALGLDLNDIDYCLRAQARGLRVVYEPLAELVHHESPSRGTSGSPEDQARFLARWEDVVLAGDPYLSPHLTRMDCSAALRGADEEKEWQLWRSNLPA